LNKKEREREEKRGKERNRQTDPSADDGAPIAQLRDKRKTDLEEHVALIAKEMRRQTRIMDGEEDAGLSSDDEDDDDDGEKGGKDWDGIPDPTPATAIPEEDAEAEYIDEDKYTTVTVEAMGGESDEDGEEEIDYAALDAAKASELHAKRNARRRPWEKRNPDGSLQPKAKKQKFRYESKADRQATRQKQKSKNAKKAASRRDG
jgi:ribosomal RNA-processing protein 17